MRIKGVESLAALLLSFRGSTSDETGGTQLQDGEDINDEPLLLPAGDWKSGKNHHDNDQKQKGDRSELELLCDSELTCYIDTSQASPGSTLSILLVGEESQLPLRIHMKGERAC